MPTVIDKLVVELGLDASKFTTGQRDAVEAFKKTQAAATVSAKGIEKSSTDAASAIIKVSQATLGLLGVFLSARGAIEFTTKITGLNAELGRLAKNLQQSPQLISALGMAAERVGGDAAATKQTIAGWAQALFDFNFNGKQLPDVLYRLQAISGIKINQTDAVKSMYDIADAMHALATAGKQKEAYFIAKELGFDEGTINLLMKGRDALKAVVEQTEKLAPSQKAIDDAAKLQASWVGLEQSATKFGTELVDTIVPATTALAENTKKVLDYMTEQKRTQDDMIAKAKVSIENGTYDPSQTGGHDVRGSGLFPWLAKLFGGGGTSAADAQAQRKALWGQSRGIEFGDGGGAGGKQIDFQKAGDEDLNGGKKLEVNGTEVTQGNPLPVRIIADASAGSGGVLQSISDWFHGSGSGGGSGGSRNVELNGGGGSGSDSITGTPHSVGKWWTPDRMQHAVERLMKEGGLSKEGAAGLVARWSGIEAAGGPGSINPKSGAAGIGQWLGSRKHGFSLNDFDSQLTHAIQEGKTSESRAWRVLQNAKTAREGARGASMYERAEGYNARTGTDNFTGSTPVERVLGMLGSKKFGATGAQAASLSSVANDNRTSRTNSNTNNLSIGHISVNADGASSAREVAGHIAPELARDWFATAANFGHV